MLFSLTVGKVDAGVAVLLTQDKRLIEFPSILLPPHISSGSIVDITVSRNLASEAESQAAFEALQEKIYTTFGQRSPSPPVLRCRNATQTSVVLEWDPIQLATADLRSLNLYRNGSKAGSIPKPLETQSTKISGLAIDNEYTFHLVLRTSAGSYSSQKLLVKTHKMTDLSGITVTPGVMPASLRESVERAVERIGAKMAETVRIDTTHFVCIEGRGPQWERAVEMNIPVVRPEWIDGCEREGRIVGVRGYYLNADPRLRQIGQGSASQTQQSPPQPQQRDSYERPDRRQVPDRASSRRFDTDQQQQPQPQTRPEQDTTRPSPNGTVVVEQSPFDPPPPTPPTKDDDEDESSAMGRPEPKTISLAATDEPKARVQDRHHLGRDGQGAPLNGGTTSTAPAGVGGGAGNDTTQQQQGSEEDDDEDDEEEEQQEEEEDGRSADAESFSEVAL